MFDIRKEVDWILLCIMLLDVFINAQLFLFVSFFYFCVLIAKNKFQLRLPKMFSFRMYLIFIVYATMVGLFLFKSRYVARDLFYILPTTIWVFIGYNYSKPCNDSWKIVLNTICIFGFIISLRCLIVFLFNFSLEFGSLRRIFGFSGYEVGFICPILITKVLILKEELFSKWIDRLMIITMFTQILLSMGRIAMLEPLVATLIMFALCVQYNKYDNAVLVRVLGLISVFLIVVIVAICVVPSQITAPFFEKISGSLTEIDSSQEINSTASAMNHWRAFEIQSAQKQWINSDLIVQLFGNGLGKGIETKYIPYSWKGVVENHEIPILHNGFYTLLPKGGIFAVLSLVLVIFESIFNGIKLIKIHKEQIIGISLVGVAVASILTTWVVRGPVVQGAFLIWGFIVGYLNKEYYDYLCIEDDEKNIGN